VDACTGFRAAVFFDSEGETIDYHSFLDPFETRLVAAYVGVFLASADSRCRWLGMGEVDHAVVYGSRWDIIAMPIGEGFSLALVIDAGESDEGTVELLGEAAGALRTEAGI